MSIFDLINKKQKRKEIKKNGKEQQTCLRESRNHGRKNHPGNCKEDS